MAVISQPIAPPIPINPITPLLFALSECVCNELATTGAGPMCWCGIYPGIAVSLEYCEECGEGVCGMGWVRMVSANPSTSFPIAFVNAPSSGGRGGVRPSSSSLIAAAVVRIQTS